MNIELLSLNIELLLLNIELLLLNIELLLLNIELLLLNIELLSLNIKLLLLNIELLLLNIEYCYKRRAIIILSTFNLFHLWQILCHLNHFDDKFEIFMFIFVISMFEIWSVQLLR